MSDIPEDVMKRAEKLLRNIEHEAEADHDYYLVWVRPMAVDAIADALMEERAAERERAKAHWLQWHHKRVEISRGLWLRASKKALDGDMRELRNRVDLAEAEPVQLVLSESQS